MNSPSTVLQIRRTTLVASFLFVLMFTGQSLASEQARLYWTNFTSGQRSTIQRGFLDGTGAETLITGLDGPWAIEIDPLRKKLYFGDVNRHMIQRANLDGTNVETVNVGITIDDPAGLAIDSANNDLYWSDFRFDRIAKTNLDTNLTTVLVGTGLTNPFGLALDLEAGKLYWADTGLSGRPGKIQRSNLDGTNVEDLVTNLANPRDVAIDTVAGHIFWPDLSQSVIYRANLDGTQAQAWLSGQKVSHGVAIDSATRRLYWTSNDGISTIKLDGTGLSVGIVPPTGQYGITTLVPEPPSLLLCTFAFLMCIVQFRRMERQSCFAIL